MLRNMASVILLCSILFSQSDRVKRKISLENFLNYNRTTVKEFDFYRQTNVQLSEYLEPNDFHFIGLDPNEKIVPDFQISTKNLIDTINLNYTTLLRSEVAFNQLKANHELDKTMYNVNVEFNVYDSKNERIFTRSIQKKVTFSTTTYRDHLFDLHKEEMTLKLPYGDYRFLVKLTDLISKIETESELGFSVDSYYRDKLLISDFRFFDSHTKREITSEKNMFTSFQGDMIVYFDTYKKNTKFQFLYDIEVNKKTRNGEKIMNFFEDVLLSVYKIGFLTDTTETEYETILFDDDKRYNQFQFRIRKSDFKDHSFYELNYGQRHFEITMKPKIQILNRVPKYNNDDQTLNVDEMTDENYLDKTIESDIDEVLIIDTKEKLYGYTTIGWDSIPESRNEFLTAFSYLSFLMNDQDVEKIDSLDLAGLKHLYVKTMTELSGKTHRNEILSYFDMLKKRIHFANQNFFYFTIVNESPTIDTRHKNGWFSDKGILYIKYGLPDEISGQNFVSKDGQVLYHYLPAKQKWFYKENQTEYYFYDNEIVHKKEFKDL